MVHVDDLIRKYERELKRVLKASRIIPTLLDRGERYVNLIRVMKALKSIGIYEVFLNIGGGKYIDHPYPLEVILAISRIREYLPDRPIMFSIYNHNDRTYLRMLIDADEFYIEIPFSSPQQLLEPPDISIGGVEGYSVESIIRYLKKCKEYVKHAYPLLGYDVVKVEECIRHLINKCEYIYSIKDSVKGFVWMPSFEYDYWNGRYIVLDEEYKKKGLRVLQRITIDHYLLYWVFERKGGVYLYAVLEDEEILREYYSYKDSMDEEVKACEKVIESRRLFNDLAVVKLEELGEIIELYYSEEGLRILKILREYCDDEAYLMIDSYFSLYRDARLSHRYPLKILYLYRKLEEYGVDVDIMIKKWESESENKLPRYLLDVKSIRFYGFNDYWKLLVKPKKDLRIDYPCDIKFEDESIVIVDREALRRALKMA